MLDLLLAIGCSALISILMRLSDSHIHEKLPMLTVNYVTCALLSAVFSLEGGLLPATDGIGTTLMLGALCGMLYLNSFVLLQWNVGRSGVVLPSVFMKLGVMVPTLLSIACFGETPTAPQIIGFALAICAIVLINLEKGSGTAGNRLGLIALLLAGGMSDAMSKIYERFGSPQLSSQYLLYTFVVALALCLALTLIKKQRFGVREALYGVALGVPNYFAAKFLLRSLSGIPAVVAYPSFSVGTIVLVTLAGVVLFREKLSARQIVGLCVIGAALVLLNL